MRVNEYFSYEGSFQKSIERSINNVYSINMGVNTVYSEGDVGYKYCPVIQRFDEAPVSIGVGNPVLHSEPVNPEKTSVLWSIVGTSCDCMDIDVYGLTDTWFVNLECVGESIEVAREIANEALVVLIKDEAILQIFTRFDEPIDTGQAGLDYRSHNLTISMNGVIGVVI